MPVPRNNQRPATHRHIPRAQFLRVAIFVEVLQITGGQKGVSRTRHVERARRKSTSTQAVDVNVGPLGGPGRW